MNTNAKFSFQLQKTKGTARAGVFETAHGQVQTPIFMPVGTVGTVKALDTKDVTDLHAQIILGNTYHLYLRPGTENLELNNGLHGFMNWQKPILTDSGGFQVMSLGKNAPERSDKQKQSLTNVSDDGVKFQSHLDGSSHFFTPERSIEIQRSIGADIIMAFDEALADSLPKEAAVTSVERTHRWAQQCYEYWEQHQRKSVYGYYQALFGIVQGGLFEDLRTESARVISSIPFDGIAVGGETVGYNMPGTAEVMNWIRDILPADKPRYAMGLGRDPQDIIAATLMGFDMFDCVGPTRLARNGTLYFGEINFENKSEDGEVVPQFVSPYNKARLQIGNKEFRTDNRVIQPGCGCYTCSQGYTRSYLHHLFRSQELTYYRLGSIHNVYTMVNISQQMREWILR
jgi:queuine tRNA-ribosyltransferase